MNTPWTEDRVEVLTLFWAEGYSISEVAQRMGATRSCIAGKLRRLNLNNRGHGNSQPPLTRDQIYRQKKAFFAPYHRIGLNKAQAARGKS